MDCFIKKIFQDKIDERVHNQFVRFGKGNYQGRALIKLQVKKDALKIQGSFEYANDFVEIVSEILGESKAEVSGIVLSKESAGGKLRDADVHISEKKKSMVFESSISQELTGKQLKLIVDNSYFSLLDVSSQGVNLKIKKKLPKPGKSGEGKIDDKFCSLELPLSMLHKVKEAFFFDAPECKKCSTIHTYEIKEIILPKDEKNFEKIRLLAKRKGKIIRKIDADGRELFKEKEFEA